MFMKVKSTLLILSLVLICTLKASAQDEKPFYYLSFEGGAHVIFIYIPEYDFIRGDLSSYGGGSVSETIYGQSDYWYAGVKLNKRTANQRFAFGTGIRYTQFNSSLGKSAGESNSSYFYMLLREDGSSTEYLKVTDIEEHSGFIGIPIEYRFFLNPRVYSKFYIKAAASVNYNVFSSRSAGFYNSSMDKYEHDITSKFDEPSDFFIPLYFGAGLILGNDQKSNVSLEFLVPSFVLTKNVSGILEPVTGFGFQLNIQIPVNKNHEA